jgi:TolB-like protein
LHLFKELQQRNVFRVSIGYIVSCWLLIQVADIVLETIAAPDWVMKTLMLLLALGFPVVAFFSWAYEVTPDGIKRESEVDRSQSTSHVTGRKLDRAIVAVLVIAVAYFSYDKFILDPKRDAALIDDIKQNVTEQAAAEPPVTALEGPDPASIAVLPFADLSPGKDQGYFSDGIAEEILNVLVRVDGLSVASRTSAFGFKDQGSLGIPAIAEALKVRNVLEGSVRKSGDTIRITAQLIDGQSDKHLWSQTYDRVLSAENLFAIQDEIAKAIVTELAKSIKLETTLTDASLVSVATENLDAYQLYLQAREIFRQRSTENIPRVIEMLEQALELDPDYAEAWAGLAAVSVIAPSWGITGRDFTRLTKDAAQRAIDLDDSLGLPYAVLGSLTSNAIPTDYVKTFEYYDQAMARDPNSVNALLWRGIDLMNVGMFEAATADLERCLVIDPLYENCRRFLALTRLYAGDTDNAFALFEKGVIRGATSQLGMFALAYIGKGDLRSGMFVLALSGVSFNNSIESSGVLFRALTEPDFEFDREWQKILNAYEAETGNKFDKNSRLDIITALAFRKYDAIRANPYVSLWWHPNTPDFHASPHRNRLIREMGIYDYWLKAGFPPQCRPVNENDFECD